MYNRLGEGQWFTWNMTLLDELCWKLNDYYQITRAVIIHWDKLMMVLSLARS